MRQATAAVGFTALIAGCIWRDGIGTGLIVGGIVLLGMAVYGHLRATK